MNIKEKGLTSSEKYVMKAIWDAKEDIAFQDLLKRVKEQYGKDYARTTVATFLKNMEEKGFVSSYHIGRTAYIHAEKSEEEYKKQFIHYNTDFWFEGSAGKVMEALFETQDITKDEICKMRKMLDEFEEKY